VDLCRTLIASFAAVALVRALPAAAGPIRPDGLLEVEGEPFFPVGLFDLGWRDWKNWSKQIRESGANCVWDFETAYTDGFPSCRAVMDSARAGGWWLLLGSPDTIYFAGVDIPIYDHDGLDALLECATGERNRILGFTNRDEPDWSIARGVVGDVDSAHIHDTYRQIHARVPDTFVAMNFAPTNLSADFETWKSGVAAFVPATDVVMHASYPYPPGPGTCIPENVLGWPDCTMDRLADNADLFRLEIKRPDQPLWMILQAYKAIPRKEARWAAWTSIVHGANGILWAGWTWVHPRGNGADIWPHMREVVREIADHHDFLVGRDATPVFASDADVEMRALERASGTEILAIAISRRGFAGTVEMQLPLAAGDVVQVVAEDRTLAHEGGRIVDAFDGYEAHVYRYPKLGGAAPASAGRFQLQAFPNPSPGRVRMVLNLPEDAAVDVRVHDAAGRRVALAASGRFAKGTAEVAWDGRDASGIRAAPGVYFLRARASSGEEATARVVLQR
jgi:hypothetical protein